MQFLTIGVISIVLAVVIFFVAIGLAIRYRLWFFKYLVLPKYRIGQKLFYYKHSKYTPCIVTETITHKDGILTKVHYEVLCTGKRWNGRIMKVPEHDLRTKVEAKGTNKGDKNESYTGI